MERYLTIQELCERFPGTTRGSWAQLRYSGKGPRYRKVGKRIFYSESDVVGFVERSARTQTGTALETA